ncbi:alpha/beta fold hydrolase [Paraburkholderia phenazinium]|uniref:alpha/beta fold hydrolase n=1 Tax=Paraburkholderia phenazinium TaxID=60549 RepID=UPI0015882D79|nr:alpha/beta fold hydrolase [Paraburkholderia phenazinium]
MKPIAFNDCLGWLHEGRSGYGVVLCEPFGHEALWGHKLMRALAERLASESIWVLRFNYPCAGDSVGDDTEPDRFANTLTSVHHAMAVLRERSGISDLALLGVRAGALFAMLAACGEGVAAAPQVDAIAALTPVVRGRSYMRELSLLQRGWLETALPAVRFGYRDEPCFSVLGHRYPLDLVDQIKSVDLCDRITRATLPANAALLVDTDYGDAAALSSALSSRGVEVTSLPFVEWPTTMLESTQSRLPLNAIDSVTKWVVKRAAICASGRQFRHDGMMQNTMDNRSETLCADGASECLVSVGPRQLAGILCVPAGSAAAWPKAPAVLIANTAANPRIADGRFAVSLARELARNGIVSLRIDVRGTGDSGEQAPDDQSTVPYSDQTVVDVGEAANWLAARGHQDVIAVGICSGAYAALHAAARTTSLTGTIAINLARFVWPAGLTLAEALKQRPNSAAGYLVSARDWRRWRRLVRERRDLRPILKSLGARLVVRFRLAAQDFAERLGRRSPSDTPRGVMHELARRDVRVLLIYGEFDAGIDELNHNFGPLQRAFKGWRNVGIRTIRQLDHALLGTSGRNAVIDFCVDTLTGRDSRQVEANSLPAAPGTSQAIRTASARVSEL